MEVNNNIHDTVPAHIVRRKNWIKCDICNIYVTSNKLLDLHKKGKKHLLIERKLQDNVFDYVCHVCKIRTNGKKQLTEHINGKAHKNKIVELREKDDFIFYCMYGIVVIMLLYMLITYTLYLLFNLF